jgi:hypothetical protein
MAPQSQRNVPFLGNSLVEPSGGKYGTSPWAVELDDKDDVDQVMELLIWRAHVNRLRSSS